MGVGVGVGVGRIPVEDVVPSVVGDVPVPDVEVPLPVVVPLIPVSLVDGGTAGSFFLQPTLVIHRPAPRARTASAMLSFFVSIFSWEF